MPTGKGIKVALIVSCEGKFEVRERCSTVIAFLYNSRTNRNIRNPDINLKYNAHVQLHFCANKEHIETFKINGWHVKTEVVVNVFQDIKSPNNNSIPENKFPNELH